MKKYYLKPFSFKIYRAFMAENIYIDRVGDNIVGALAKGGDLLEYNVEKENKKQIVGSIFKGRVKNVLPGMQAAFIDVGLDKNGYLFVGESLIETTEAGGAVEKETAITANVGDEIMVQAVKDPIGTKGARLTTNLSFAGKFLVYVPSFETDSISRKIEDETLRASIEKSLLKIKRKTGGFIARTASEHADLSDLKYEAKRLIRHYEETVKKFKTANVGDVLYSDGDIVTRLVRDVYNVNVEKITVANREIYERLNSLPGFFADIKDKLELYDKKTDMFRDKGLIKDVESLLHNRVDLKSGAYLIIDKTEALTVIDVNTGSFVGDDKLEDTVFETNLVAAKEIARQVRLRNVGGIVVVDFIDMVSVEHREALVGYLTAELKKDRIKCNVIGMTGLGLVEFTRRKKRRGVDELLNKPCPYCGGDGKILSDDYIVMKIRTLLLDVFSDGFKSAIIELNADVCNYILKNGSLKKDVDAFYKGKRVYLIPHRTYHQECFSVRGDNGDVLNLPDKAKLLY